MPEAPNTIHAQYNMELADAAPMNSAQAKVPEITVSAPKAQFPLPGWPKEWANLKGDPSPKPVCP